MRGSEGFSKCVKVTLLVKGRAGISAWLCRTLKLPPSTILLCTLPHLYPSDGSANGSKSRKSRLCVWVCVCVHAHTRVHVFGRSASSVLHRKRCPLCLKPQILSPAPSLCTQEQAGTGGCHFVCRALRPHLCPLQCHRHALLCDGVLPRPHLQRSLSARLGAQPEASHIHCHEPSPVPDPQRGLPGCRPGQLWEAR